MKLSVFALALFFSIVVFPITVWASPSLHNPQPINNTYVSGGQKTFSVNATSSNFNSSSAVVHVISLDAYQHGETWTNYSLSCSNTGSEWKCSNSLSFSIAGSDTTELFYFDASDNDGTVGSNGTVSSPLVFTIDRSPPVITFTNPQNNSYVSGNKSTTLSVIDTSSGVNASTVQYSTDNTTWTTMQLTGGLYQSYWNTNTFSNNQTVTLYARAADNVNNSATTNINVIVDNEIPQLIVLSSFSGTLSGNIQMQVNASDSYSGVDFNNVKYTVDTISGSLGCAGTVYNATCSAVVNTAVLADGNHTLNFTVTDRAGNTNTTSLQIKTSNTQPSVSITNINNNAYVRGSLLVTAAVSNAAGSVSGVQATLGTTTANMACNSNFTSCNYTFDTTALADGGYSLKVSAANNLNLDISSTISITVDNTKPTVSIILPGALVKSDFEIRVNVVDANLDTGKVNFTLAAFNGSLSCTQQTPTQNTCSTFFNSRQLSDGNYTLTIFAADKAGNSGSASESIIVGNAASGTNGGSSNPGSANSGTNNPGSANSGNNNPGSANSGNNPQNSPNNTNNPWDNFWNKIFPNISDKTLLTIVLGAVIVIVAAIVIIARERLEKNIISS